MYFRAVLFLSEIFVSGLKCKRMEMDFWRLKLDFENPLSIINETIKKCISRDNIEYLKNNFLNVVELT